MSLLNKFLCKVFYKLGEKIGQKPVFFIVSSIFISLFCGSGLFWFRYEDNFERLFATSSGRSLVEREKVDKYFPSSGPGSFNPSRATDIPSYARVIIEAADGGSILRKSVFDEIRQVDEIIQSVWPASGQNYSNLCGKWDGECFENNVLDLGQIMGQIENGSIDVSYPVMFNPETFSVHLIPFQLGGLTLSNDSFSVDSAQAVGLNYFLDVGTEVKRGRAWEQEVIDGIERGRRQWKHITVYLRTVSTDRFEQINIMLEPLPWMSITILIMSIFLGVSSLSTDWVRAKPYAGILGMLCANLGTLAGIGMITFLGTPLIGMVASIPFIMIGIGVDDAFVILAAWRQTNLLDPVPKRLAHCYEEAGVSITITTLTDMLSFYVGLMTPVEGIQIFSAFAGTCVIWIYLLQIFLFGGCLAISGRQEAENKHGALWWKEVMPKSNAEGKSRIFRLFCTGGIDKANLKIADEKSESAAMLWFQNGYSGFLVSFWGKAFVMTAFLTYLAMACYGMTIMETGLHFKDMYKQGSVMYTFHEKEEHYFDKYPYRVQVIITTPVDYSNETVQHQINEIISKMNASGYIALEYSENWLESYLRFLKSDNLNATDSQNFIKILSQDFLNGSSSAFREDIRFNEDFTEILASRFILQSKDGASKLDLHNMAETFREITDNETNFNVSVYNHFFITTDIDFILENLTFQLLGTACAVVMAVSIIFLPSFICAISVFATMLTTELGVVGFMCLWGLRLDLLSMVCLMICIGFAVDFTAHVSYAYVSAEGSSEDRVRQAMYSLGMPVLQGGLSTVIGMSALFFIPNYSYAVMAKIITLVMAFSAFHALLVLPVIFLLIKPERFSCKPKFSSTGNYNLNISESNSQIKNTVST